LRKETWTKEEFQALNDKMALIRAQNSKLSPSKEFASLLRLYEKHQYGITSRDLALGKTIDFHDNGDGTYTQVEADCRGYFKRNPDDRSAPLVCHFEMSKFKETNGKRLTFKEYLRDGQHVRDNRDQMIKLADDPDTTITDMGGAGSTLLETGVLSGFGTATGVVPPRWVNWLMELVSLKAFMKNFISIQPMDEMQVMFPLKTSVIEDNTEFQAAAVPTVEGRAGTEHHIVWANYQINGWKYLRYSELTNEVSEMLDKYLNVTSKYAEELAEGHTLLWDYAINKGIQQMLVKGSWRYPELSTGSFSWEEGSGTEVEIPFGKASVLTTNALKNYLFQDLSGGSDGTIYNPSVTTTEEFKYDESTVRGDSSAGDEIVDGLAALATVLKNKGSSMEYVIFTDSRITERFFKDDRVQNNLYDFGKQKYQDENGFLGTVSIAGSSTFVDVWESPANLIGTRDTDDTVADTAYPIFGGRYGEGWHQGVYSSVNLRVDEGFEVLTDAGSVERIRPTETKVLTTSSKGSSWPGDYHHIAILWAMLDDAHA
jgi:hypothetical protein